MSPVENTFNIETADKEDAVLLFIHQKKTIPYMARQLHKSLRTIQIVTQALEDKGLVELPEGLRFKKAARIATPKGIERLRKVGLVE